MSSEFRYHIASLAAVFLALGIGILIGAGFVGTPLVDRQTALIKNLETSVGQIRRDTRAARRGEEALRLLLPRLVHGKLAGQRILVIQTGPYSDAAKEAVEALRLAGATDIKRIALPPDAWRRAALEANAAAGANADPSDSGEEWAAAEAKRLAPLLLGADPNSETLKSFRQKGLLTGDAVDFAARYVVLIGGGGKAAPPKSQTAGANNANPEETPETTLARRRDAALIAAWQEETASLPGSAISIVGAEPAEAGISFMDTYQSADIATIDNIDQAVGQIVLPFALLGEKAAYGVKATADRILPPSLEKFTAPEEIVPADAP